MNADRIDKLNAFLRKLDTEDIEIEMEGNGLALLDLALTHPTYAFEHRSPAHNQRLEFLGDAVLNLVVAERLYHEFPDMSEGDLTRLRAVMVCGGTLADAARDLGIGDLLLLGHGEERNGGRNRPSNLADAMEAVAGALYLAAGLPAAKRLADMVFDRVLKEKTGLGLVDSKTRLQELIQKKGPANVIYRVLAEWGPDHDKRFRAAVFYKGQLLATGEGRSKKGAEQEAARLALYRLSSGEIVLPKV